MSELDLERARREELRWRVLVALDKQRPEFVAESILLSALRPEYPTLTAVELRCELDYLRDKELVELEGETGASWQARLALYGIDAVEGTAKAPRGVSRPELEVSMEIARRGHLRWRILRTLYIGRFSAHQNEPLPCSSG